MDWYYRFTEVDNCAVVVYESAVFLTRCILMCLREEDHNVHNLLCNDSEKKYIYTYMHERKTEKTNEIIG